MGIQPRTEATTREIETRARAGELASLSVLTDGLHAFAVARESLLRANAPA